VDEKRFATVGDSSPQFKNQDTDFGIGHELDMGSVRDKELKASIYAEYGEAPKSLNRVLQKDLSVVVIEVEDNSEVWISRVVYDKNTERVKVYIKNTGEVTCYAYPELTLTLDGEEETRRINAPIKIDTGDTIDASYRITLSDADLSDNEIVSLHTLYGERESLLAKSMDERRVMEVASGLSVIPIAVAVILGLGLLLAILSFRRRNHD